MNLLHSTMDVLRDKYLARVSHTSTFRKTGQITPEEFVEAGDYLVYKFPSWSWADAASPAKRVSYLPEGKQYLVTRGVPCRRRIDANFAGEAGQDETIVRDGFEAGASGGREDDDDGWLRTGNMAASQEARLRDVRTVDEAGEVGAAEEEEEIPDMEAEDDDEAIIRDHHGEQGEASALRHYTLYITYTPYYKTPRLYLAGFRGNTSEPIPPSLMFEDIVGDYQDKTVTPEDFPFLDAGVKMASVHPCRHASVMKILLDRADAALKARIERVREGKEKPETVDSGMEGLIDKTEALKLAEKERTAGPSAGHEEWEEVQHETGSPAEDEVAIRVDQYLIVFLKFIASVTPGIEHDFTMSV